MPSSMPPAPIPQGQRSLKTLLVAALLTSIALLVLLPAQARKSAYFDSFDFDWRDSAPHCFAITITMVNDILPFILVGALLNVVAFIAIRRARTRGLFVLVVLWIVWGIGAMVVLSVPKPRVMDPWNQQ